MRWLIVFVLLHSSLAFRMPSLGRAVGPNFSSRQTERSAFLTRKVKVAPPVKPSQPPFLLPKSATEGIANFVNATNMDGRILMCNMIATADIHGVKYGIGFPTDIPVMLTYFEDNQLKPVQPDYPNYDHLVSYIDHSLDDSDLKLYNTPVVLTLEGDLDEEELNQDPFELHQSQQAKKQAKKSFSTHFSVPSTVTGADKIKRQNNRNKRQSDDDFSATTSTTSDEDDEEEPIELSLEELMYSENIPADEAAYDSSDIEDEDEDEDDETDDTDFDSQTTTPNTKTNPYTTYNPNPTRANTNADAMDGVTVIPASQLTAEQLAHLHLPHFEPRAEHLVTDEDTRSLNRAHRRADKIMDYAADMKLIGSFHYEKKNFHLVRLLEVSTCLQVPLSSHLAGRFILATINGHSPIRIVSCA